MVDVVALGFEGHDPFAEFFQRAGVLGRAAVLGTVEAQDFADFRQAEPHPLAAQDQDQAGAVTIAIDPVHAVAAGRKQALVFVEAEGAGSDFELNAKLTDRIGALKAAQIARHRLSPYILT